MTPAIASLWIGPRLRWLDRLCLQSFVARGHDVTLYHTHDTAPEGLPEGVTATPARTIWDDPHDLAARLAPAAWADIFRLLMVQRTGAIWVDTDVICHRPFELVGGRLYGREHGTWINNAVLHLPPDSPALTWACAHLPDPSFVPPWLPDDARQQAEEAAPDERLAAACRAVPNALGPRALTHILRQHGEARFALPPEVLNPVPWGLADCHFNPHGGIEGWLSELTIGVHLFASRIRQLHWRVRPYEGSFLDRVAREIGFDYGDLPVRRG